LPQSAEQRLQVHRGAFADILAVRLQELRRRSPPGILQPEQKIGRRQLL
jgi:hypothetical protein